MSNEPVYKLSYKNYSIKIYSDPHCDSPDNLDDQLAKRMCFSRNYHLSNYKHSNNIENALRDLLDEQQLDLLNKYEEKKTEELAYTYEAERSDILEYAEKCNLILPLYLYDHSGITISTTPFGCRWDSGQVGWIYISHADIIKEYGSLADENIAKAKSVLEGELKRYDDYLRGEVYGYVTYDPQGEQLDSCWGYFGDHLETTIIQDAKDSIDRHERENLPLLARAGLLTE